jgi:hypothetical protein
MHVHLPKLAAELAAAGIPTPRGLGHDGDGPHTYDDRGRRRELPPEAAAVLAAHVPPPAPDYGDDDAPQDQLAEAVAKLRAYLGLPAPTAAQTMGALKLLIRVVLFVVKRQG